MFDIRPNRRGLGKPAESAVHSVYAKAGQRELAGFSFIRVTAKAYATTRPPPALSVR